MGEGQAGACPSPMSGSHHVACRHGFAAQAE